jgi:hypothetical protein
MLASGSVPGSALASASGSGRRSAWASWSGSASAWRSGSRWWLGSTYGPACWRASAQASASRKAHRPPDRATGCRSIQVSPPRRSLRYRLPHSTDRPSTRRRMRRRRGGVAVDIAGRAERRADVDEQQGEGDDDRAGSHGPAEVPWSPGPRPAVRGRSWRFGATWSPGGKRHDRDRRLRLVRLSRRRRNNGRRSHDCPLRRPRHRIGVGAGRTGAIRRVPAPAARIQLADRTVTQPDPRPDRGHVDRPPAPLADGRRRAAGIRCLAPLHDHGRSVARDGVMRTAVTSRCRPDATHLSRHGPSRDASGRVARRRLRGIRTEVDQCPSTNRCLAP